MLVVGAGCGDDIKVGPDANPDDLDGDGILNAADDCPQNYDPQQHDEDGDGVGDECDNCPTVVNPGQQDTTEEANMQFADGVGDACDLRPALAGDRIARFYPFSDPAQASAWAGDGWTIDNDEVHAAAGIPASWSSVRGETGDGVAAVARVESLTWGNTGSGELAVVIDGAGVYIGAVCAVTAAGDLHAYEPAAMEMTTSLGSPIGDGEAISITAWRRIVTVGTSRTGKLLCRVHRASGDHELEIDLTDALGTGIQTLAASDADAVISSVIVYTFPGPRPGN